jgi:hypothetical protein
MAVQVDVASESEGRRLSTLQVIEEVIIMEDLLQFIVIVNVWSYR